MIINNYYLYEQMPLAIPIYVTELFISNQSLKIVIHKAILKVYVHICKNSNIE